MFEGLKDMCRNARKLNQGKIIKEIFQDKDLQTDIANLNREQLYEYGIDSKGKSLGEYTPHTKQIKEEKGQRIDHITLKDSSKFYDSIKVKSNSGEVTVRADTKKPDRDLAEDFGIDILGLTDENIQVVQGMVLPIFREKVLEGIFA